MARQKNQNIQGSKPAPLGGQPGYGGITEGTVGANIGGEPLPGGPQKNEQGYPGGSGGKSEQGEQPSLIDDRDEGNARRATAQAEIGQAMPGDESIASEQPLRQGESSESREGSLAGSGGSVDRQQPLRQGETGGGHQGAVANPSNAYTGAPPRGDGTSDPSKSGAV